MFKVSLLDICQIFGTSQTSKHKSKYPGNTHEIGPLSFSKPDWNGLCTYRHQANGSFYLSFLI